MSKVSSNAARFNKMKSRRNVHRAKMRVLRAEMEARKPASVSGVGNAKAISGPADPSVDS